MSPRTAAQWQPDTPAPAHGHEHPGVGRVPQRGAGRAGFPDEVAAGVVTEMASRYASRVPLSRARTGWYGTRGRWPLGLASCHRPPDRGRALALGLSDAFRVTLSTELVPHGKPAPTVYLAVASRLDAEPSRCAAIEDSSNGVRSAAGGRHARARRAPRVPPGRRRRTHAAPSPRPHRPDPTLSRP